MAVTPDYSEVAKLADLWLHPKQGTDAALAMAMGHVILKEFYSSTQAVARTSTTTPPLHRHADAGEAQGADLPDGRRAGARPLPARVATSPTGSARPTTRNGRRWPSTSDRQASCCRNGSIGFRWGQKAAPTRQVEPRGRRRRATARDVKLKLSLLEDGAQAHEVVDVAFPYFGGIAHDALPANDQGGDVLVRNVPGAHRARQARRRRGAGRHRVRPAGARNYGVDRGLPGELAATSLRRRRALHAGLAGEDHRRAARPGRSRWRASSPTTPTRRTASR